jgi:hypothetical protein
MCHPPLRLAGLLLVFTALVFPEDDGKSVVRMKRATFKTYLRWNIAHAIRVA